MLALRAAKDAEIGQNACQRMRYDHADYWSAATQSASEIYLRYGFGGLTQS